MSVSEILAQAPLLLSTVLSKQKNMGQPPLVPFFTTIKPLETGDIVIEVCTNNVVFYIMSSYNEYDINVREDVTFY